MSFTGGLGNDLKSTNSSSSALLVLEDENDLEVTALAGLDEPTNDLATVPFLAAIFLIDLESMVLQKTLYNI